MFGQLRLRRERERLRAAFALSCAAFEAMSEVADTLKADRNFYRDALQNWIRAAGEIAKERDALKAQLEAIRATLDPASPPPTDPTAPSDSCGSAP